MSPHTTGFAYSGTHPPKLPIEGTRDMPATDEPLSPSERQDRLEQLDKLSRHMIEADHHRLRAEVAMMNLRRDHSSGAYNVTWALYMERANYAQIAEEAKLLYLEHLTGPDLAL